MEEKLKDQSSGSDSEWDIHEAFEDLFSTSSSSSSSSLTSSSLFSLTDLEILWSDSSETILSDSSSLNHKDSKEKTDKSGHLNKVETINREDHSENNEIALFKNKSNFSDKTNITLNENVGTISPTKYTYEIESFFNVNESDDTSQKNLNNLSSTIIETKEVKKLINSDNNTIKTNLHQPFCEICGENFISQEILDVHKLNHLVAELYPCKICGYKSQNREDFLLHSRMHNPNDACYHETMKNKKKSDHGMKSHECKCGKSFQFYSGYKRHLETHINSHTCNICHLSFPSLLLCHQHKLKHVRRKVYTCKVCNKVFHRPYQLTGHMQVHEENKKYECKECGTNYGYKTSLMRHNLKYHSPDSPKFHCSECGELFKSKKILNCHTILHTAKKTIQCNECSQTFKYRSSYHRHKLIHQGQKPFRCNHCGKLFRNEEILKNHKKLHFSKEAFSCNICDKTFAYEYFLKKHMLIHTNADDKSTTDMSDEDNMK